MRMRAALIEFELESMALYLREFYASRMGTLQYFSKEAVASALSYEEMFKRDKKDDWKELEYAFDNTPAFPKNIRIDEIIYKAGDNPNIGLLKYGKQEVMMPGSIFIAGLWGDYPDLEKGQSFFIGKKRGSAIIKELNEFDVELEQRPTGKILPIQVSPKSLSKLEKYIPIVATARFFIVQPSPTGRSRWLNFDEWSIPVWHE